MSKQANKTLIGVFVVGAVALVVAGMLVFGSGKFFKKINKYVAYFDESVKGLNVGAPVNWNGVRIGSVTDVYLSANFDNMSIRVPVFMEIEPGRIHVMAGKMGAPAENLSRLIDKGLKAQLQMQSLVTGQLMIQVDYHPDKPVVMRGKGNTVPEIPTIPSTSEELSATFEKLDLQALVRDLRSTIKGIEKTVNDPEIAKTIHSVRLAVEDIRELVQNVDHQVQPLSDRIDVTLQDYGTLARDVDKQVEPVATDIRVAVNDYGELARNINEEVDPLSGRLSKAIDAAILALEEAQQAISDTEVLLSEDSTVLYDLEQMLREISAAARSIRLLSDYIKQHPEAFITGKGKSGGK